AGERGEVADVLGNQATAVRGGGVQDGGVVGAGELGGCGHGQDVVPLVPQHVGQQRRVHLVKQQAGGRGHDARGFPRSRDCSVCHAASASRAACRLASTRSSISSG